MRGDAGTPVLQKAAAAFTEMGSTVGANLGNYMAGLVLLSSARSSMGAGPSSLGESAAFAIAAETAAEQRAMQAMGEENLYLRVMRPMIAFFEALLYALTPFMLLLIGTGPAGLQMISKYALLTLWVNLWFPVLAIVNLYEQTQLQHLFQSIRLNAAGTSPETSVLGLLNIHDQVVNVLTSTSMLAASTPALTLSLLMGGAVTASALASRLQGGDHFNEKLPAPTAMNDMTVYSPQPMMTSDSAHGVHRSGVIGTLVNHNFSQGFERASQSAWQRSEAMARSAVESYGSALNSSEGSSKVLEDGLSAGFNQMSQEQKAEVMRATTNAGFQWQEGYDFGHVLAGAISMSARAGLDSKALPAGIEGSGSQSDSSSQGHRTSSSRDLAKAITNDKTLQSAVSRAYTSAANYAVKHNDTWAKMASSNQSLAASVTASEQSQRSYTDSRAYSAGARVDQRLDDLALAKRFAEKDAASNGTLHTELMRMTNENPALHDAYQANYRGLSDLGVGNAQDRANLAAYYTLEGIGPGAQHLPNDSASINQRVNDLAVAASYVTELGDAALSQTTNADANSDIARGVSADHAQDTIEHISAGAHQTPTVTHEGTARVEANAQAAKEASAHDGRGAVATAAAVEAQRLIDGTQPALQTEAGKFKDAEVQNSASWLSAVSTGGYGAVEAELRYLGVTKHPDDPAKITISPDASPASTHSP